MEWLLAILVLGTLLALLPRLLRASRKAQGKSRRKGTAGGIMMGMGLAFMTIFDPGKSDSVEEIQRRKDLGDDDQGESGAGKD
ncbi:hypothetical protein [Alteraurantiacibacter aestuarii]